MTESSDYTSQSAGYTSEQVAAADAEVNAANAEQAKADQADRAQQAAESGFTLAPNEPRPDPDYSTGTPWGGADAAGFEGSRDEVGAITDQPVAGQAPVEPLLAPDAPRQAAPESAPKDGA